MNTTNSMKGHIVSAYMEEKGHRFNQRKVLIGKVIEKINIPYKSYKGFIPVTGYLILQNNNAIAPILGQNIIKYWADNEMYEIKFSLLQTVNSLYNFKNMEQDVKSAITQVKGKKVNQEQITNAILHIVQAIDNIDTEYLNNNALEFDKATL